jgi:hypothetical protein
MSETVIVVRDKKAREIRAFVNLDSIGAQASVEDFMRLVAEFYGSPATTMTRAGHEEALQAAALQAISHMKRQTTQVAAVNLEPAPKSPSA